MKTINCDQARQLSIVDYLAECGINPQYIRGFNHWYLSPIREENTASFKVNTKLNAWYDHGIGAGGNFIDLGIRLHQCTVEELLARLSNGDRSLSFHQPVNQSAAEPEHKIKIIHAGPLQNLTLVKYLHGREIDYDLAKEWCKEVLFSVDEKRQLAIGFANRSGGYELRAAAIKLSSSPKDLTFIDKGAKSVNVVEGFMDFLSLLSLREQYTPGTNFIVLNSINMATRSLEILQQHHHVFLYLDHDEAGSKARENIMQQVPHAVDASTFYRDQQDINDYLKIHRQDRGLHL